eukprot:1156630-Pelagomonas_calceolata.AAC.10
MEGALGRSAGRPCVTPHDTICVVGWQHTVFMKKAFEKTHVLAQRAMVCLQRRLVCQQYPKVKILTSEIDQEVDQNFVVVPGALLRVRRASSESVSLRTGSSAREAGVELGFGENSGSSCPHSPQGSKGNASAAE